MTRLSPGPVRFQCPPEFEAVAPSPHPALQGGALGGPSTELWLIRAPADFCPERYARGGGGK